MEYFAASAAFVLMWVIAPVFRENRWDPSLLSSLHKIMPLLSSTALAAHNQWAVVSEMDLADLALGACAQGTVFPS